MQAITLRVRGYGVCVCVCVCACPDFLLNSICGNVTLMENVFRGDICKDY